MVAAHPNWAVSISFPFGISFDLPDKDGNGAKFLVKAVAAPYTALWILRFTLRMVEDRFNELAGLRKQEELHAATKRLLEAIRLKAGIQMVFVPNPHQAVAQQEYADAMIKKLSKTKTLRMMSYAGYEYIGKGYDSLFLPLIQKRKELEVEIIVLDEEKRSDLLEKRVKELRSRDSEYSVAAMKRQIQETTKQLTELVAGRKPIDGKVRWWKTVSDPVFRLIIFDDCLFLSTYEKNCHGHESPVYLIDRPTNDESLSLFNSFVAHFEDVKARLKAKKPNGVAKV